MRIQYALIGVFAFTLTSCSNLNRNGLVHSILGVGIKDLIPTSTNDSGDGEGEGGDDDTGDDLSFLGGEGSCNEIIEVPTFYDPFPIENQDTAVAINNSAFLNKSADLYIASTELSNPNEIHACNLTLDDLLKFNKASTVHFVNDGGQNFYTYSLPYTGEPFYFFHVLIDQGQPYVSTIAKVLIQQDNGGPSGTVLSENFESSGTNPAGWIDNTLSGNSIGENDSLFTLTDDPENSSNRVLHTSSTQTNIFTHSTLGSSWGSNGGGYEVKALMRRDHSSGALGLTLYSHFPNENILYRWRTTPNIDGKEAFHVAPHYSGDSSGKCLDNGSDFVSTGVEPEVNKWYWIKVKAVPEGTGMKMQAKVWKKNQSEPNWQATCTHSSPGSMAIGGTVGFWSMGSGKKYYDDVSVTLLDPPPQLAISLPPGEMTAGVPFSGVQVYLPESLGQDTQVNLQTSGSAAEFYHSSCLGSPISSITVPAGSFFQSVCLKTNLAGTVNLTASAEGYSIAQESVQVSSGSPSQVEILGSGYPILGFCNSNYRAVIQDSYGNSSGGGSHNVSLSIPNYSVDFYNGSGCHGSTVSSVSIPNGESEAEFSFKISDDQDPGESQLIAQSAGLSGDNLNLEIGGDGLKVIPGSGPVGSTPIPGPQGSSSHPGYDAKVIGNWDVVPHQDFDQPLAVGVVAVHRDGINRVEFSAHGGPWTAVAHKSLNPRTQVDEFWVILDPADFQNHGINGAFELRARIIPNIGISRALTPIYLNVFPNGIPSLKPQNEATLVRYVDAINGSDSNPGTKNSPQRTIGKAAKSLGSNAGGGRIRLMNPSGGKVHYSWGPQPGSENPILTGTRYLTVEPDTLGPAEENFINSNIVIIRSSDSDDKNGIRVERVRIRNVRVRERIRSGSPDPDNEQYSIWADNANLSARGRHDDVSAAGQGWFMEYKGGKYSTDGMHQHARFGPIHHRLVRGTEIKHIGDDVFRGCQTVLRASVDRVSNDKIDTSPGSEDMNEDGTFYTPFGDNPGGGTGNDTWHTDFVAFESCPDNHTFQDVRATRMDAQGYYMSCGNTILRKNFALINSLIHTTGPFISQIDVEIHHLIFRNNTFHGDALTMRSDLTSDFDFRGNHFYGLKSTAPAGKCQDKGDWEKPDAASLEAGSVWADNNFGIPPEPSNIIDPPPGYGEGSSTIGPADFINPGELNFHVNSSSALKNRIADPLVRADLDGTLRSTSGNSSCSNGQCSTVGAYE